MNPASLIAATLSDRGHRTQRAQARILQVSEQAWSRYVRGEKDPQISTILRWLRAADSAGNPMSLTLRGTLGDQIDFGTRNPFVCLWCGSLSPPL